jgi:tetratricopeptide (TPR) repeat protein
MNLLSKGAHHERLDQLGVWAVIALTALLPVFVIPSVSFPFQFGKLLLLVVGVVLATVLTLLARLQQGTMEIPKSYILGAIWLVPIGYILSGLFSGASLLDSLVGVNADPDGIIPMVAFAMLATLAATLFSSHKRVLSLYLAVLGAFGVVLLYQLIRLFAPVDSFLSFGFLSGPTANIVGKWYDFGIFAGLVGILALLALETLRLPKVSKRIFWGALIASLVALFVVNFTLLWVILGIVAFAFFMASVLRTTVAARHGAEGESRRKISILALCIVILSGFATLAVQPINNMLTDVFQIQYLEVRPSWAATTEVGRGVLASQPFFGSGPGTFDQGWLKFKDATVNLTPFWGVDFTSGFGFVPTSFITTGILGGLLWIVFFGTLLGLGIWALLRESQRDHMSHYVMTSSFLGAVYLFFLTLVYVPNVVLLAFAFLLAGVFIAALRAQGTIQAFKISFLNNMRVGFAVVSGITLGLLVTVAVGYVAVASYAASLLLQSGIVAASKGQVDQAETFATNSIQIRGTSDAHILLANIELARMREVAARTEGSPEEIRAEFEQALAGAVTQATRATQIDPNNARAWSVLSGVYQSVVPLKIQGAYEAAKEKLDVAIRLAPSTPELYLAAAQLEFANGNIPAAQAAVEKALTVKENYIDAIFLSAQLALNGNNVRGAIDSVKAAQRFQPTNAVIAFELGLLYYGVGSWNDAIGEFTRAVELAPDYANARYYLALSLNSVGRTEEAVAAMEMVSQANPDNQGVKDILANMKAGKQPVGDAPLRSRANLPVDEE